MHKPPVHAGGFVGFVSACGGDSKLSASAKITLVTKPARLSLGKDPDTLKRP